MPSDTPGSIFLGTSLFAACGAAAGKPIASAWRFVEISEDQDTMRIRPFIRCR